MAPWPFWQPFRRPAAMAFLGLGSNVGDRLATLRSALHVLHEHEKVAVEAVSTVYETAPVTGDSADRSGVTQEAYLNLVAGVTTSLRPRDLLELAHAIETAHGRAREREPRWGPRTLDIDILLYEDLTLDEVDLTIPHPRLTERAFVLVPLTEVVPPGTRLPDGTTVMSHLARLAPITGVNPYVRLVEGPGTAAEPLAHRPTGPIGGPPRLGTAHGTDDR